MSAINLGPLEWSDDEGLALTATGCGCQYRLQAVAHDAHGDPVLFGVTLFAPGVEIEMGEAGRAMAERAAADDHTSRVALWRAAQAAEREACAQVAKAYAGTCAKDEAAGSPGAFERAIGALDVMQEIRARGEDAK